MLLFLSFVLHAQTGIKEKAILSLKKMFGDSVTVREQIFHLTKAEVDSILTIAKTGWRDDRVDAYICSTKGKVVGYGFVDNVKGKVQFITYLVGVGVNGEVNDVDVLVYREAYGSEITYESFRKQFRNKTARDKFRPGRDIKNISGATISARAITQGVGRVLATFSILQSQLQNK